MKPRGTRILRRLLLGVVAVVAVAVAWTLRRPAPPEDGRVSPGAAPAEGTTIGDLSFFQFDEGEQRVQVKAREMTGPEGGPMQLKGVEVTFPYVLRGEESSATITSEECVYEPGKDRALFRGSVHVVTEDGFELWSEELDYLGDERRVKSDVEVEFGRGTTTGRSRGAVYDMTTERIDLRSEVWIRFADEEGGPPTEIESGRAWGERRTRHLRFLDGVRLTSGPQVLTSKRLRVLLGDNFEGIWHAAAIEDVDLRMSGEGEVRGTRLPPGGSRRLRSRRLNVDFHREEGRLTSAVAVRNAFVEILPAPGEAQVKRRIEGNQIHFKFDQLERLRSVQASGIQGGAPAVLLGEPLPGAPEPTRRVESQGIRLQLDPESGALLKGTFQGGVVFTEPDRTVKARNAVYDGRTEILQLRGGAPRIRDDADGSELQAQKIDVATNTRAVTAVGGVRHQIRRGGDPGGGGGMLTGSEPAVLVCGRFEYDSAAKKAIYRENALLRSGRDEIRAPQIVLEDPAPLKRRLHATGGVLSVLHPRAEEEAESEPAPVEARSQEMVYEEEAGQVVYTGSVEIRQGDIVTLSPRAVVTLDVASDTVEKIVAGQPVEVHQGARKATGTTGTYTPRTETMVLEGEEVVLQDVDRKVRGRILTFQVGEDRIRVDGREEARTEAIFRKRGTPTP